MMKRRIYSILLFSLLSLAILTGFAWQVQAGQVQAPAPTGVRGQWPVISDQLKEDVSMSRTPNPDVKASAGESETDADCKKKGVPMVILMYHAILPGKAGKWVVSPNLLEADLKFLQKGGYTAVTVADLLDYQLRDVPLPEKPVMLTFDDGSRTNYTYAFPLLKKYNQKAVMAVVGAFIDKGYRANGFEDNTCRTSLTYAQIREMHESGLVEIQNHSYDLHKIEERNGMKIKRGESYEAYERVLKDDLFKLEQVLEERAGVRCNAVAFPFGSYTKDAFRAVKNLGYCASFTCNEGVNYISKDTDLFYLKRYNRDSERDIGRIMRTS